MSTITIAAIIGGGIITLIVVIYVAQYRRRSAEAQRREIQIATDRLRLYSNLATGIQPAFLSPSVRIALADQALSAIQDLIQNGKKEAADQIPEWTALKESARASGTPSARVATDNDAAVAEQRNLLKSLHKFVENQARSNGMPRAEAQTQLELIRANMARVLADAHHGKARAAARARKFRVAIHHLHDAVTAWSPIQSQSVAQQQISTLREEIANLEKEATADQMAKNEQAPTSSNTRLAAQLEANADNEDPWKKKQAYDD